MQQTNDDDGVIYVCPQCDWEGTKSQTADDGPNYPYCCPLCGCPDLIEASDSVGDRLDFKLVRKVEHIPQKGEFVGLGETP